VAVEISDRDGGTAIHVHEEDAAVAVYSDGEESVYLPSDGSDSTYYVESSSVLRRESGFTVFHPGEVDRVELIASE
jgi:hypothetical protein